MDDGQSLDTDDIIAGRYRVIREIGHGGMGRVYEVTQLDADERIALKIMRPELAAFVTRMRFLREVDIASRLSHPHILPILASGETDDSLFYTMPLLSGGTLRHRLASRGPQSIADVLALAAAVGEALDYAGEQGIVHRDVKPENILFESNGRPMLADFGIARAVDQAAGENLTYSQVGIGTASYMSPEQHSGAAVIDARTDQYSLAIVLYEMLAGSPPFSGISPQAIFARKTFDPLPSLRAVRREVPENMERAIARALAVTPADRFQSLAEFTTALSVPGIPRNHRRRVGLAASVIAAAAVGAVLWNQKSHPPTPIAPSRIAVVPFENVSGDSTLNVVGIMAADWISEGLSRTGVVQVVPTPTVLEMRSTLAQSGFVRPDANVERSAQLLRADVLVTGRLYILRDSIRVQSQISDLKLKTLLDAIPPVVVNRKDPMAAIEELRTRVMGLIASRVDPQLASTAGPASAPTFEAYRAFSGGLEEYARNDFRLAITRFKLAVELDSTFLTPLLFASISHSNLGQYAIADSLARRMNGAPETLNPYNRAWLEYRLRLLSGDRPGALTSVRQLSRLNPGSKATYNHAVEAFENGYVDEARIALESLDIDNLPMATWIPWWDVMGSCHHLAWNYGAEAKIGAQARQRFPQRLFAFLPTVRALAALGSFGELRTVLATAAVLPRDVYGTTFGTLLIESAKETSAHHGAPKAVEFFKAAREWYAAHDVENLETRAYIDLELGDAASARRTLGTIASTDSAPPRTLGLLGVISVAVGDTATARRLSGLLDAERRPYGFGEAPRAAARIRAALGEREAAINLLQRAIQEGMAYDSWLHTTREFESLSNDRRFRQLTKEK